jgi:hypothetical protein
LTSRISTCLKVPVGNGGSGIGNKKFLMPRWNKCIAKHSESTSRQSFSYYIFYFFFNKFHSNVIPWRKRVFRF